MQAVFWLSAIFIAYVYAGYGLLLHVWVRLRGAVPPDADTPDQSWPARGTTLQPASSRARGVRLQPDLPSLSVIIAARNEARRLPARIDNLLELDYPHDRLQVVVVSDGSTDDVYGAVARFGRQVELVQIPRSGKAVALNAGVARATGDILVFADARQTFAPDALLALTAPFADPGVGGVSGELILGAESAAGRRDGSDRRGLDAAWDRRDRRRQDRRAGSTIGEGVGFYWKYEKHLRRLESEVGSMLGATGAIYALRRPLWRPLPAGTLLDDVLAPMRAVLAGARVIFEPRAQAFDVVSTDARAEARRKLRTLAGNVQILWFEPRLLLPIVNPVWLQYMSHKVGRLLVPYALLALFASSIILAHTSWIYLAALFAQAAFYLHSGYGAWLDHWHAVDAPRSLIQRTGRVAFTFVVMNVAAVAGVGAAFCGRKVWR